MTNKFFSHAKFVLPWQIVAFTTFVMLVMMMATVGDTDKTVVQTNVPCKVGDAVIEHSDIQIKLTCSDDSGNFQSQIKSSKIVLMVLKEHTQELRCNIRKDKLAASCEP